MFDRYHDVNLYNQCSINNEKIYKKLAYIKNYFTLTFLEYCPGMKCPTHVSINVPAIVRLS